MKLHLGCGENIVEGWVNADIWARRERGVKWVDITQRITLQWKPETFDVIAAHHVLNELSWDGVRAALENCHWLLKPGGVLRVSVPDIWAAFMAARSGRTDWFPTGDKATTIDEMFCGYLSWFGTNRTQFTGPFLRELLERAGFRDILRLACGHSRVPGAAELDDRCSESIIMEALR